MDAESKSTAKRRRGAQPGNVNALKHGFYATLFRPAEMSDLETMLESGLAGEVAMLRVMTRRVLALAGGVDDLDEAVGLLRALGVACARLASLLKAEKALAGEGESLARAAISQALTEVVEELRGKG